MILNIFSLFKFDFVIQESDPIYGPRGVSCLPLVRLVIIFLAIIFLAIIFLAIIFLAIIFLVIIFLVIIFLVIIFALIRSATICEGEQQNLATAFLDGSQIYGGVGAYPPLS